MLKLLSRPSPLHYMAAGAAVAFAASKFTPSPVHAGQEGFKAICVLHPDGKGNEQINGIVRFSQEKGGVRVEAEVNGLSKGKHGFHIHQLGDLSKGCTTAGPHFNPFDKTHGGPKDSTRHVGDMGNLESDGKTAKLNYVDHLIELDGNNSVIGRSVVVHADEDDLGKGGHSDSKTTGHAGGRVACGVIGRAN